MATSLDPPRWLAPPQRAPEPQPPVRASDAATSALAHYEEFMSQQMISLLEQALAECAELAAHTQRVETARFVTLAAWRRQEDAAHAQALAEEADIQRHRDDTFRAITDEFAIDLNILAVKMATWHGADDAMALLAMKHPKDDANAQGYLDGHAAKAHHKAATHANVLAASRRQKDNAYAKAFASATDKRNRRETTLHANQLRYVAQLGFTSSSEFFAWVAECNASRDGAVSKAPNRTHALAEKLLAEERRHHKTATQEKVLADEANERCWAAARDKALADEANERRQAAAREKALVDEANKRCQAPARQKALAKDKRCQEESAAIRRIRVQCALLAAPLDAILAKIERDNIAHEDNEGRRADTREKALADKANKQSWAATRKKALADEVNKQCRHVTAVRENALADNAYEQRYQESANESPPLPPPYYV
jgi:hypothetical protein